MPRAVAADAPVIAVVGAAPEAPHVDVDQRTEVAGQLVDVDSGSAVDLRREFVRQDEGAHAPRLPGRSMDRRIAPLRRRRRGCARSRRGRMACSPPAPTRRSRPASSDGRPCTRAPGRRAGADRCAALVRGRRRGHREGRHRGSRGPARARPRPARTPKAARSRERPTPRRWRRRAAAPGSARRPRPRTGRAPVTTSAARRPADRPPSSSVPCVARSPRPPTTLVRPWIAMPVPGCRSRCGNGGIGHSRIRMPRPGPPIRHGSGGTPSEQAIARLLVARRLGYSPVVSFEHR